MKNVLGKRSVLTGRWSVHMLSEAQGHVTEGVAELVSIVVVCAGLVGNKCMSMQLCPGTPVKHSSASAELFSE